MAYWDTSCLLKLYAPEADSAALEAHLASGAAVVTSEITRWELWAALRRKEAAGDLSAGGARQALRAYDADILAGQIAMEPLSAAVVTEFEAIIEKCVGQTPPVLLRTLDAMHLAAATVAGEVELVATDRRLREAALTLGFRVYPPP